MNTSASLLVVELAAAELGLDAAARSGFLGLQIVLLRLRKLVSSGLVGLLAFVSTSIGCSEIVSPGSITENYSERNTDDSGSLTFEESSVGNDTQARALPTATVTHVCRELYAGVLGEREADPSFAVLTHLLLLDGEQAQAVINGRKHRVLSILTDSTLLEEYFGVSSLIQSRHGVAFLTKEIAGEYHRDQILAAFAQCSIPLNRSIRVQEKTFSVQDLLNDSLANSHLKQEELAWTAVAYAQYLPPARSWSNKFGTTLTFDDVTRVLLSSPLAEASCGGLHNIAAISQIMKSHQRHPILTAGVAGDAESYLKQCVAAAVQAQFPDGSWNPSWIHEFEPDAPRHAADETLRSKLLVTGHLLEWLLKLPAAERPPGDVLQKAADHLADRLGVMTSEEITDQFCPVTHAILSLRR